MKKKKKIVLLVVGLVLIMPLIISSIVLFKHIKSNNPDDRLKEYFNLLNERKYEDMYNLISSDSKEKISEEDFVSRNKNIYEGIDAKDIAINIETSEKDKNGTKINYDITMKTLAGELEFKNSVVINTDRKNGYVLEWNSNVIFPELNDDDKLRISTIKAKRGSILDRNNVQLAYDGTAANVGVVPEKLGDNKDDSINKIASILGITSDDINKKLNATYVKPDMFVPISVIASGDERIESLLAINGVMVNDKDSRVYPYGMQSAHLTGYVQAINAEELEANKDKEYNSNSIIGKTGIEKIYEDKLRGIDGAQIYIEDKNGKKKSMLLSKDPKNGTDVKLTIDSKIQSQLYSELNGDKGLSVAMNPNTGEVLGLVSTPAYDPNDFAMGLSADKWNSLNNDKNKPLYNRFQGTSVPGSLFKTITALIGVDSGKIDPNANKNINGLAWQKDKSWGNYYVTRVSAYNGPSNLENGLIYSDNIYFAQAALDIGKDIFKQKLVNFGFGEKIPFEYPLYNSQFSANGDFKTDIQLADSGYGQGEILANPVQLAAIYSLFLNNGNILTPYLEYNSSNAGKVWKENVVSKNTVNTVLQDLIQVVENKNGTGHQAYTEGLTIAGKTGTAEIKASQDDTTGTELGWFLGMTTNKAPNNLLVVTMIEDVKDRGESHYVVPKVKDVLETVK